MENNKDKRGGTMQYRELIIDPSDSEKWYRSVPVGPRMNSLREVRKVIEGVCSNGVIVKDLDDAIRDKEFLNRGVRDIRNHVDGVIPHRIWAYLDPHAGIFYAGVQAIDPSSDKNLDRYIVDTRKYRKHRKDKGMEVSL